MGKDDGISKRGYDHEKKTRSCPDPGFPARLQPAGGAVIGGAQAYDAGDARHAIVDDLQQKSLQTKAIAPATLAYGFIFFPAEAKTAKSLRVQVVEKDTGKSYVLTFNL